MGLSLNQTVDNKSDLYDKVNAELGKEFSGSLDNASQKVESENKFQEKFTAYKKLYSKIHGDPGKGNEGDINKEKSPGNSGNFNEYIKDIQNAREEYQKLKDQLDATNAEIDEKVGVVSQAEVEKLLDKGELIGNQMNDMITKYGRDRLEMPDLVGDHRYEQLLEVIYREVEKVSPFTLSMTDLLGILRKIDSPGQNAMDDAMKQGLTPDQIHIRENCLSSINASPKYQAYQAEKNVQVTSFKQSVDGYTITMSLHWKGDQKLTITIPNIINGYYDLNELKLSKEHPEDDSKNNTDNAS